MARFKGWRGSAAVKGRQGKVSKLVIAEADVKKFLRDFLEVHRAQRHLLYIRVNPTRIVGAGRFVPVDESQRGCSDFIVFPMGGKAKFWETKTTGERLRTKQEDWQALAIKCGYEYTKIDDMTTAELVCSVVMAEIRRAEFPKIEIGQKGWLA